MDCRYYPTRKRLMRYFESVLVTTGMLIVALIFMICSLNLQVENDEKNVSRVSTATRPHRISPVFFCRYCRYVLVHAHQLFQRRYTRVFFSFSF